MNPTLLLAIAVSLFVAPPIYVLTASMLSQQGALAGEMISRATEIKFWSAGIACLLAPFAIPWLLRSSARSVQLLLALVVSVGASLLGFVLSFTTGRQAPVRALGVASMLAILGWAWGFRECFEAERIERIVPRYTNVLMLLGIIFLLSVVVRVAIGDRAVESAGGLASSEFMIFVDATVGISALSVARLRQLGSAYARPATQVLAWSLLGLPLLGTLVALYWLFAVRKQEQGITTSGRGA